MNIKEFKKFIQCKGIKHVTYNDIKLICNCAKIGDYSNVFTTRLYISHGVDYCRLLEALHEVKYNIIY